MYTYSDNNNNNNSNNNNNNDNNNNDNNICIKYTKLLKFIEYFFQISCK